MTNLPKGKPLNFIENRLNYRSLKVSTSDGNVANFATLRGFLYAGPDSTDQRNFKKI